MKKAIFALVAGLSMTTQVIAADAGSAIPSGTAIPATTAGCSLLSEDVTINLSNNVFGAYACNITDNVVKQTRGRGLRIVKHTRNGPIPS